MIVLRTERLTLAPLGPMDIALIRAHWEDPAVRQWMWSQTAPSTEQMQKILSASQDSFAEHNWGLWCIHYDNFVVGVCGLRAVPDHPQHVELICSLGMAWWGQGLAAEAALAVLRTGFAQGLEHVVVGVTDDDHAAGRAFVERLGFGGALELSQPLGVVAYWGLTAHTFEVLHPVDWRCLPFDRLSALALYELLALRAEVFVVEQDCAYQDVDGKDPLALHLLGRGSGGELAAYLRIFAPDTLRSEIVIGRVVTSPEARGQGLGTKLMRQGMRRSWRLWGDHPIHVSAQAHLQDWYNSLGFVVCGPGYPEDGIPHLPMRCPGKAALA